MAGDDNNLVIVDFRGPRTLWFTTWAATSGRDKIEHIVKLNWVVSGNGLGSHNLSY